MVSSMSTMEAAPDRIAVGQTWTSGGGARWRVRQRRARAHGYVEVLIESTGGATRWVMESDLREEYTFAEES